MERTELSASIMDSDEVRCLENEVALRVLLQDHPAIVREAEPANVDWPYALQIASALVLDGSAETQTSALRLMQGCLLGDAEPREKESALMLLDRMGNSRAVTLAEQRDLAVAPAPQQMSLVHRLDFMRSRMEHLVRDSTGEVIQVNDFQSEFWRAADSALWISVSAPTSAGKSYIVQRWLRSRISEDGDTLCIYLVPTRALIDEVSAELATTIPSSARIFTIPWDKEIQGSGSEVFVLTQERLHFLYDSFPNLKPDLLFVDEAQKFGDGSRGILLHRVVSESSRRNPNLQVIFATPLAENPSVLLQGAPALSSTSLVDVEAITVTQSVVWASQKRGSPKVWNISTIVGDREVHVGHLTLDNSPGQITKRLPLVAYALGKLSTGNVVYVNGPADAEAAAKVIFDAMGASGNMPDGSPVYELMDLVRKSIHPNYALVSVLSRGVAFHYGNMPQLVRSEIDRLLRDGVIRFLVCTSTLLEGVNLPCRTIFARGPKKGKGNPMSMADFWNLAGRAGRWGKEFQGTIVCVDANNESQWPEKPRERRKQPIRRAFREAIDDYATLLQYVVSAVPENPVATRELEYTFSFLCARVASGADIDSLFEGALDSEVGARVVAAVERALISTIVPAGVFTRHPGVSPVAMQRLYVAFEAYSGAVTDLTLPTPDSNDAPDGYAHALALVAGTLGGDFNHPKRRTQLAFLMTHWMRGWPLSKLISDRWSYESSLAKPKSLDSVIRAVMSDIENFARFEIPRYLDCYSDLLKLYASNNGLSELVANQPDIAMMLELGVSRVSDVSMLALGLSRTATVMVSEILVQEALTPEQCLQWLRVNRPLLNDLPQAVQSEVDRIVGSTT